MNRQELADRLEVESYRPVSRYEHPTRMRADLDGAGRLEELLRRLLWLVGCEVKRAEGVARDRRAG